MKALTSLVLLLALVWSAGLLAFAWRVAASTPAPDPPRSDGVVALTGASTMRIEAASALLEQGLAQRMLISGVNPDATREQVRLATHTAGRAFDCCVDLGFQAENTVGNAEETAGWSRYHHYRSLILVTADYHMPRALLELRAAMPRIRLHPYPVATNTLDVRRWWASPEAARRMIVEYSKYLAVLGRGYVGRLDALAHRLAHRPAATPAQADARAGA